ncbi:TPR repeat protein [Kordia sp. SMS9]|uniref:SIR2 family protein n=1 Tax=Kordia sp. SMS9 TaxID=2282170 RepID=UPI000E0DFA18|nr:SIR2 family protein [Kordia sp. SMS9]AXG68796.1 TPR repeat protein [Kordia sp. SMS9]
MTAKTYSFHPEILEAIKKDNLVMFVGAGLSFNLENKQNQKIGDWNNLVLLILNDLKNQNYEDADLLIPLIGKFDPIDILDLIEKRETINIGVIKNFTKGFFDLKEDNDLSLHDKICKLTNQIITTNYDCAFEEVNPMLRKNIAHTGNRHELVNFTKSTIPTLFKLHGTYERSDSMILFSSDYDSLYTNPNNDAELTLLTLRNTILSKTVLFIGCSMSDFQINELFQYIKTLKGIHNQKHFIITKNTLDSSLSFLEAITIEDYSETNLVIEQLLKEKERFTSQKTPEQELLEQQINETEKKVIFLEKKLDNVKNESERKNTLLELGAIEFYKKGREFELKKDYDKAIEKYKMSNKLHPKKSIVYTSWAECLKAIAKPKNNKELYAKAIEKYEEAIECDQENILAINNLSDAQNTLGNLKNDEKLFLKAIENCKKVLKLNSKYENAFVNWGNSYLFLGLLKSEENLFLSSIKMYESAIEINTNNCASYSNLGHALSQLGHLKNDRNLIKLAIKNCKKAIKINPNSVEGYNNLAVALTSLGILKNKKKFHLQAIEYCEKAIEINPNFTKLHSNHALALGNLGQLKNDQNLLKKAIEKYSLVTKDDPIYSSAIYNSGNFLYYLGKINDDEKLIKQAIEKYKSISSDKQFNLKIKYNLGTLYNFLGNLKNDEKLIKQAIESYKKIPDSKYLRTTYKLGNALYNLGNITKDKKSYQKALEKFEIALTIEKNNPYIYVDRLNTLIELTWLKKDINLLKLVKEKNEEYFNLFGDIRYHTFEAKISEIENRLSHSILKKPKN